jgi:hypothetical protein
MSRIVRIVFSWNAARCRPSPKPRLQRGHGCIQSLAADMAAVRIEENEILVRWFIDRAATARFASYWSSTSM